MTPSDASVVLRQLRETLRVSTPSFETTQVALQMAIDALDHAPDVSEVIHAVAAISEYGKWGDRDYPYDAQVSLLTITKARKLVEMGS